MGTSILPHDLEPCVEDNRSAFRISRNWQERLSTLMWPSRPSSGTVKVPLLVTNRPTFIFFPILLEAVVLTKEYGSGVGEVVQVEFESTLAFTKARGGDIRQSLQAVEVEVFLVLAEALG